MNEALSWSTDGAQWPHREASSFHAAAGLRWHVQRMGSGPALLLLHGTGASTHSWQQLMPILARRFACVAVDLPGHAFTSAAPHRQLSLPGMARGVAALTASLGIEPEVIVGHSAGAAIAVQMCIDDARPAAKTVVSLNGAFMPFEGLPGLLLPTAAKLLAAAPGASRLMARWVSDRQAVVRLLRDTGSDVQRINVERYLLLARHPAHVNAAVAMMAQWDLGALAKRLAELLAPIHLIAARNDRTVAARHSRFAHARVPHGSLHMLEGAGHLAHEEKPAEVAELILQCVAPGTQPTPCAAEAQGAQE